MIFKKQHCSESHISRNCLKFILNFYFRKNISSFHYWKSFGALVSSFGSKSSGLKTFSNIIGLNEQCNKLKNSYNCKNLSIFYEPPFMIRLLLVLFSLLVDFGLGLRGDYCFDNERQLLSATLIDFR